MATPHQINYQAEHSQQLSLSEPHHIVVERRLSVHPVANTFLVRVLRCEGICCNQLKSDNFVFAFTKLQSIVTEY